jgi:uncharacterized protein
MERRRRRRWPLIVLAIVLLLGLAYAATGAVAWAAKTGVEECKWPDVTPANFPGQWRFENDKVIVDSTRYQWDDFKDVQIPSATEGITLQAWWSAPTKPKRGAVLVVHGRNSCRGDPQVLMPAGMLHRAGFGVLVIDLRDSGLSTREDGRWAGGVDEWQDVTGAWRWLRAKGFDAKAIGLMGVSMGTGAISLAMAREPAMAAAFLDSPWADLPSETIYLANEEVPGLGVLVPGMLAMGQLISGDEFFGLSPERGFRESLAGRPISIVHGEEDKTIPSEQGERLAAAAEASGSPVDLWLLPGVEHVQAAFVKTDEYRRRLVEFFTERLART